jgi:prolipoprotein diacylglyceryltransferase
MWLYLKTSAKNRPGLLLGVFFVMIFTPRFFIEFIKENQEAFESGMMLNMGQWLSIPFILGGIYLIIRAIKKPEVVFQNKKT